LGDRRYTDLRPGDLVLDEDAQRYAVVHHIGVLNGMGDETAVWGIWKVTEEEAEKAYAAAPPGSLKAYRSGFFIFHAGDGPFYTIIKRGIPVRNPSVGASVMNPGDRENAAKKAVERFTWMPARRVKTVQIPALDRKVRRITSFKTLIYESNKRLDNPRGNIKLYYHPWEDRHDRAVCITDDGRWIIAVGRAVVRKEGVDDLPFGTRPKPVKMSEVRAVPVWAFLATLIGVDLPCAKKDGGTLRYIPREGWRCDVCGGKKPLYRMKRGMVLYDEKSRLVVAISKVE
jgi:hypothetical protein